VRKGARHGVLFEKGYEKGRGGRTKNSLKSIIEKAKEGRQSREQLQSKAEG